MSKKILCKKLNKELPALNNPPMPGPKGIELMNSISEDYESAAGFKALD